MSTNQQAFHHRVRTLCECAIMVALATVLSMIKVYDAPYGGSVTLLSMAPIIVLSMMGGIKVGLAAGFANALVQLLLGLNNVAWVPTAWGIVLCIVLDYLLPFTALGLGGMFRRVRFTSKTAANTIFAALLGTVVVTGFRFLCHVVSGAVIWYSLNLEWYAGDPAHIVHQYGPWLFSLIYNATFMVPEILETCIGVPLLCLGLKRG